MSIQTLRSLSQLQAQAKALGLSVKPTKRTSSGEMKYSKDDFVYALRDYFLSIKDDKTLGLEMMLKLESPMLCRQFKDLKPEEQKDIWREGSKWYFEEKIDGNRMVIIYTDKDGLEFFSRNNSVEDFLPVPYTQNILMENVDLTPLKGMNFMIDSEVVSTNPNISTVLGSRGVVTATQLQATTAILALNPTQSLEIQRVDPLKFLVFDCMFKDNEDLRDKPLKDRKRALKVIFDALKQTGLIVEHPAMTTKNKKDFYEQIIARGGEGVVAKHIDSKYISTSSRSRDGWIKIKRSASESLLNAGISDTLDAFVSGFELGDEEKGWAGLVGCLIFSVYLRDKDGNVSDTPHEIAKVTNIPLELRKQITVTKDGEPTLHPKMYGKVASIDGQDISARSLRLTHARLVNWRPDRSVDNCIVDKSWLESEVL